MNSWRQTFGANNNRPSRGLKRYKTETGTEFPSHAQFSGDKWPEGKNPAKTEIQAYEEGNRQMQSDKRKEDNAAHFNSALMSEKGKRQTVDKKLSEDGVRPSYAAYDSFLGATGEKLVKCPDCGYTGEEQEFSPLGGSYVCPRCDMAFDSDDDALSATSDEDYSEFTPRAFKTASAFYRCPECKYQGTDFADVTPGLVRCPRCHRVFEESEGLSRQRERGWVDPAVPKGRRPKGIRKDDLLSWRNIFGLTKETDISFKNKPDGTVQIDIVSNPNVPLSQNPNTNEPGPYSPEEIQQGAPGTSPQAEASLNIQKSPITRGALSKLLRTGALPVHREKALKRISSFIKSQSTFVDKVEGSDTLISGLLQHIAKRYSAAKANEIIDRCNLISLGWQKEDEKTVTASLEKKAQYQVGDRVKNIYFGQTGQVESIDTDGDLHLLLENGSTAVWSPSEVNLVERGNRPAMTGFTPFARHKSVEQTVEQTVESSQSSHGSSTRYWPISKIGNTVLEGFECAKDAGIRIVRGAEVLETVKYAKQGHSWRELINQALWEEKLKEYEKKASV